MSTLTLTGPHVTHKQARCQRVHECSCARLDALRWLARWLEETDATLDKTVMVASALAALGGRGDRAALDTLHAFA